MPHPTICRSDLPFLGTAIDSLRDKQGCLIRLYPTDGAQCMWNLERSEVTLGRGMECSIRLEDDAASRKHAVIILDDEGCLLKDLQSTNGTYVNNVSVKEHRLAAGDCIRIGTHVLKYLSADHIEFQYHKTVFRMTTRDGLTQAFNRQYLDDFLEREIERVAVHKHPFSVMLMDIDRFKQVNDNHGHLVGDETLRQFSERVSAVLNGGDLFARYGGEEFAAILSVCEKDEAQRMGEKVRRVVCDRPFMTHVGMLPITASFGVVTWNGTGVKPSVEDLLRVADENLYAAKNGGRNQVRWSEYVAMPLKSTVRARSRE